MPTTVLLFLETEDYNHNVKKILRISLALLLYFNSKVCDKFWNLHNFRNMLIRDIIQIIFRGILRGNI